MTIDSGYAGARLWHWPFPKDSFWANSLLPDSYKLQSIEFPQVVTPLTGLCCQEIRCSQCNSQIGQIVIKDDSMGKVKVEYVNRFLMNENNIGIDLLGSVESDQQ